LVINFDASLRRMHADTLRGMAPAEAGPSQAQTRQCLDHRGRKTDCATALTEATIAQARAADVQANAALAGDVVGLLTFLAAVVAAIFAGRAAVHTRRGADAARETVDETKKMNVAVVRPHVAVEEASIEFDVGNNCVPTIRLTTRSAGSFTALDWECQLLLKYRIHGTDGERKTVLHQWGNRGVKGVSLPPGDRSPRIPMVVSLPLNVGEQAAIVSGQINEGLLVDLTVFCRCFDVFGNPVDDRYHFGETLFNLFNILAQNGNDANFAVPLQRIPLGTQIEGQEDRVPDAPNRE